MPVLRCGSGLVGWRELGWGKHIYSYAILWCTTASLRWGAYKGENDVEILHPDQAQIADLDQASILPFRQRRQHMQSNLANDLQWDHSKLILRRFRWTSVPVTNLFR